MYKLLPILSGSLRETLLSIQEKNDNDVINEILTIDTFVNNFNDICYGFTEEFGNEIIEKIINPRITDEVRMITIRSGEFDVSFLPKGKDPEYGPHNVWLRKNRQTGKPARIFQKLLTKEFKTRDWEIFTNLFKAELCQCTNFELVSGEDIRYWYNEDHYYKCDGTLGNSCMRYEHTQPYFDIYVDHAKMLITKKDNLLTGRAIVWEINGKTILDRVYTCFDYLENCFIDYAKEQGWWIRDDNSLLSTGDKQGWLTPDDNYTNIDYTEFTLNIDKKYYSFPYMDSFRYYNGETVLSTCPIFSYALDSTDGEVRGESYVCAECGATFYGYEDETPEGLHWSEWSEDYYCDECCWYSDGLDDYIPNSEEQVPVYSRWGYSMYPRSYVDDNFISNPDGSETSEEIVCIDNSYYFITNKIKFNEEIGKYEIRPNTE